MSTITHASRYFADHPAEAMRDALGLVLLCAAFLVGFTLPAFF